MNEQQEVFYKELGVSASKIMRVNSYVSSSSGLIDEKIRADIDSFFDGEKVFIASGFPRKIYNHDWCIRYVLENPTYKLVLFIYGDGEEKERLIMAASGCERIRLFFDCEQDVFNYALSKSSLYLRPNSIDSFGIAVADALAFGIEAIASDVCKRCLGAYLFSSGSYADFCESIGEVLRGGNIRIENVNGFPPFSYSDFSALGFKKESL